ncbi:hypothetical protein [Streptomyces rimosus]|uniref:hypothetical protein n=1 Tax=Streptomyces rimosus TaxID=1927 RepID=UPI0004C5BD70|nr:hypothetical protein [Streptomyces rimosus]
MAKNRGTEGVDMAALAQTRIESVDAPTHLGSGDQINGTQVNGDITVVDGDHTETFISRDFSR